MKKETTNEIKPIIITDTENDVKYTLTFNRESVKFAEMRGFEIGDIESHPMTRIPELFYYSFRANHKNISREKTDKILFDDLKGMPDGMLERLAQLYTAPFNAFSQNEEDAKNCKLTVEL